MKHMSPSEAQQLIDDYEGLVSEQAVVKEDYLDLGRQLPQMSAVEKAIALERYGALASDLSRYKHEVAVRKQDYRDAQAVVKRAGARRQLDAQSASFGDGRRTMREAGRKHLERQAANKRAMEDALRREGMLD